MVPWLDANADESQRFPIALRQRNAMYATEADLSRPPPGTLLVDGQQMRMASMAVFSGFLFSL